MIMKITLEQWQTFKAVIDEGSFARAAEVLNKSQSSISYIIARLQEQLPVAPLVQKGRKAELTEAGKLLYRHASDLLAQAEQLEKTAQHLAKGWESEVAIAADALVPIDRVFCGLQAFSQVCPNTRIRIYETTLSGTDEALLSKQADIALSARVPPGFLGEPLLDVTMVPVASSDHALARLKTVSEQDLKQQRQIVVRDSGTKREQDSGWLGADQRWTVSWFSTSIAALKSGLGFAFVPLHRVERLLAEGSLVQLPLEGGGTRRIPLYLIVAEQSHAGPAVRAVAEKILAHF